MKLLISCINLILGFTYSIINTIYPIRDVYISSLIQPEQIFYIQNSIAKIGLNQTFNKHSNYIRIQYKNDIIANTAMTANLYSIGDFVVTETIISFNPNLYDEVLGCVILHELGHSMGLFHNSNVDSIMNYTLYIDDGYILNDDTECLLSDDDYAGINYIKKNMINII
jgi:hypothetical protein